MINIKLNDTKLTPKQNNFCWYYLLCFNATKAYQEAYSVKPSTASRAGHRLLNNVEISRHIHNIRERQSTNLYLNRQDVLRRLIAMFYLDVDDYVHFGNRPAVNRFGQHYRKSYIYFRNEDDVDTSLIQGLTNGRNGSHVILPDKLRIAELLLKYLPPAQNHNVKNDSLVQAFFDGVKNIGHHNEPKR